VYICVYIYIYIYIDACVSVCVCVFGHCRVARVNLTGSQGTSRRYSIQLCKGICVDTCAYMCVCVYINACV